jgi:hypothetical protein
MTKGPISSSPVITINGSLYVGSEDGSLYVIEDGGPPTNAVSSSAALTRTQLIVVAIFPALAFCVCCVLLLYYLSQAQGIGEKSLELSSIYGQKDVVDSVISQANDSKLSISISSGDKKQISDKDDVELNPMASSAGGGLASSASSGICGNFGMSCVSGFCCCVGGAAAVAQSQKYDIYLSCRMTSILFVRYIFMELVDQGYSVCFADEELKIENKKTIQNRIHNSDVFIACVNSTYQSNEVTSLEIDSAIKEKKIGVSIHLEANFATWADKKFSKSIDSLFAANGRDKNKNKVFDMSMLASQDRWFNSDGPSDEMKAQMKDSVKSLVKLLKDVNCHPKRQLDGIETL